MTPQSRDRGLAWFTNVMARWVPDAITAAVILTFLTLAIALALGNPAIARDRMPITRACGCCCPSPCR